MKNYRPAENVSIVTSGSTDTSGKTTRWVSLSINYLQAIHNIPVLNSGFTVHVNETGHVTDFYRMGDKLDNAIFPDPSKSISRETAEKSFLANLKMELQYNEHQPTKIQSFPPEIAETKPVLMYGPAFYTSVLPIDAITGKTTVIWPGLNQQPQIVKLAPLGKQLVGHSKEKVAGILKNEFDFDTSTMEASATTQDSIGVDDHSHPFITYSWIENTHSNKQPRMAIYRHRRREFYSCMG
ncbi:hypothetical protein [Aneurinibacillus terranovensis]|uniref:hypothetical protein n=1 Tax=Aneurinibacillus terranovensis TaxID=278991 RepID=UPI0004274DC6|nr:hypothetical protein [Aneurinibacillus terranovensis]